MGIGIKANRLHEGGELIFGNSSVSHSFVLFRKNMLKRSSNCVIIAVKITILALHAIFLDGAEVKIFYECGPALFGVFIAIAFVCVSKLQSWVLHA